jgi:hypothetical protein
MNKTVKPKDEKPKKCFVCRSGATAKIQTGKGEQFICPACAILLDKAPPYKNYRGNIIPKHKLEPSQIEAMILKQKAAR